MKAGLLAGRQAAGSSFSPLDIAGLWGWYDASDAATITESSGAVSQWNDKAGNNRHIAQPTSANRPTTGTRTLNSLNVLDFDGTNDNLGIASVAESVLGLTTYTTFAVAGGDADHTDGRRLVVAGIPGQPDFNRNDAVVFFNDWDTTVEMNTYGNSAGVNLGGAVAATTNIWTTRKLNASSANNVTIWEGEGASSATGTISLTGTASLFRIGAAANPSLYWDGIVAEVIVYTTALSDTDRDAVWAYLADKWGL